MGRKNRHDRRNHGGGQTYTRNWEDFPKRGRSRTRSPTTERTVEHQSHSRKRERYAESVSRSPSPVRGRSYGSPGYERRQSIPQERGFSRSPSPKYRREGSRPPVDDHRREGRGYSPERPQSKPSGIRSRSPSPRTGDRPKSRKWRNRKSRNEKKYGKGRDRDRRGKTGHRVHDIWKPDQSSGSPPHSRAREHSPRGSSPRRHSYSPSPRRDRPSTAGSSHGYYNDARPSSSGHDRREPWPPASQSNLPPTSPTRYPSSSRGERSNSRFRPIENERDSSLHQIRRASPTPQRFEEYPQRPSHTSNERDSHPYEESRPPRTRGGDYDREEWERTHPPEPKERYEREIRYHSNYPEQPRSGYDSYPSVSEPRYHDSRAYPEDVPSRTTPQGPRAQYDDQYRPTYPYEHDRQSYEQAAYPPHDHPKSHSPRPYSQQFPDTRFDETYRDNRSIHPEPRQITPLPPQEVYPPQPPFIPHDQNGLPPTTLPPLHPSPPTGPSAPNGGIKPFTLKGKALKNLKKRAHEPDSEPDRLVKSSRTSPRHISASKIPTALRPPPAEIQQTQTPETPSNREGIQERRVTMKEKGEKMFERIGQVGEGTYGKVYKARNTLTGELVALKKIRMESERDGFPITAMREIKLLESLKHPNVIHLQEMMFEKSYVYMVFEYMDHDLAGILTHPNFSFEPAHIKELLRQMLEGLHYLHHRGILHRDIKGSNILLNTSGQLKLADFGLARHYHKRRDNLDYSNRVITLWYRPPELLLGTTTYGPAVDIWSIGCIMLEMITKKAIFPGQNEIDQLSRIWNIIGTPTSETWPKVTELPWWELVKPPAVIPEVFHRDYEGILSPEGLDLAFKLLALNPERRPSAVEALQHPYFTKELPRPERPTGLVLDGEWHEFESKNRKRVQKLREQELKRAAPPSSSHSINTEKGSNA